MYYSQYCFSVTPKDKSASYGPDDQMLRTVGSSTTVQWVGHSRASQQCWRVRCGGEDIQYYEMDLLPCLYKISTVPLNYLLVLCAFASYGICPILIWGELVK